MDRYIVRYMGMLWYVWDLLSDTFVGNGGFSHQKDADRKCKELNDD